MSLHLFFFHRLSPRFSPLVDPLIHTLPDPIGFLVVLLVHRTGKDVGLVVRVLKLVRIGGDLLASAGSGGLLGWTLLSSGTDIGSSGKPGCSREKVRRRERVG